MGIWRASHSNTGHWLRFNNRTNDISFRGRFDIGKFISKATSMVTPRPSNVNDFAVHLVTVHGQTSWTTKQKLAVKQDNMFWKLYLFLFIYRTIPSKKMILFVLFCFVCCNEQTISQIQLDRNGSRVAGCFVFEIFDRGGWSCADPRAQLLVHSKPISSS